MSDAQRSLTAISQWIDTSPGYAGCSDETVLWRRTMKASSELGEVVREVDLLGIKKGAIDSVRREVLDVAVAALGAVEHIRGPGTLDRLSERLQEPLASPYGTRDPDTIRWMLTGVTSGIGQVTDALAGAVGENPRKGITHTMDDVVDRLLSVAARSLSVISSMNEPGDPSPVTRLEEHIVNVAIRAGLED